MSLRVLNQDPQGVIMAFSRVMGRINFKNADTASITMTGTHIVANCKYPKKNANVSL